MPRLILLNPGAVALSHRGRDALLEFGEGGGWAERRKTYRGCYAGQGKLASSIFRIANMGDIRPSELDDFGAIAESSFESKRA